MDRERVCETERKERMCERNQPVETSSGPCAGYNNLYMFSIENK